MDHKSSLIFQILFKKEFYEGGIQLFCVKNFWVWKLVLVCKNMFLFDLHFIFRNAAFNQQINIVWYSYYFWK